MAKLTEKNRQWWEVVSLNPNLNLYFSSKLNAILNQFYERFDTMNETSLGPVVKKNGYHLQLLGVHPDYQKKGISTAFDKAMSEQVRLRLNSRVFTTD